MRARAHAPPLQQLPPWRQPLRLPSSPAVACTKPISVFPETPNTPLPCALHCWRWSCWPGRALRLSRLFLKKQHQTDKPQPPPGILQDIMRRHNLLGRRPSSPILVLLLLLLSLLPEGQQAQILLAPCPLLLCSRLLLCPVRSEGRLASSFSKIKPAFLPLPLLRRCMRGCRPHRLPKRQL